MGRSKDLDQLTWGAVKYGKFLAAVIKFIIVAFVLFLIIRSMNRFKRKEKAAAPAAPAEDILLLREIRDELKKK